MTRPARQVWAMLSRAPEAWEPVSWGGWGRLSSLATGGSAGQVREV